MNGFTSKAWVAAASLLLLASGADALRPLRIATPSFRPDPEGHLECVATASGRKPIEMVTAMMAVDGENVTDFGSSFRAGPPATTDGRYIAEDRAGTMNDRESYCVVVVSNVRRHDVFVVLTSHDRNGAIIGSVTK